MAPPYHINVDNSTNCSSYHISVKDLHVGLNVVLYASVGSLVSFLIIIGNLLIIASIIKFPRLRSTSNILIANLAVSDLMVGLFLLPLNITIMALPKLQIIKFVCLAKTFTWLYIIGSSVLNLFLLSIDRLFAIGKPMRYRTFNSRNIAIVCCLVTWLGWTAMCLILFGFLNTWQCNKTCILIHVLSKYVYQPIAVFLGFVFMLSCGSFVAIVRMMLKLKNRQIGRIAKDTKKKTGVIVCVFGLCVICLIPVLICSVYASSVGFFKHRLLIDWIILLGGMNSLLNSAIYGWKRKEFRRAYHSILTCSQNQDRVHPSATYPAVLSYPIHVVPGNRMAT